MGSLAEERAQLAAARHSVLRKIGVLDDRVLSRAAPLRPTHAGPEIFFWPAQSLGALRLVRCPDSVVIVSDGLSDPWDPELHPSPPPWRFGLELALEVPTRWLPGASDDAIVHSWMVSLLWALTDWIVGEKRDIKGTLLRFDCSTLAAPQIVGLEAFVGANGFIGTLLGIPFVGNALRVQAVLAPLAGGDAVWLVPLKLLTADEYDWVLGVNDGARAVKLAQAFLHNGERHLSGPQRPSILPAILPV